MLSWGVMGQERGCKKCANAKKNTEHIKCEGTDSDSKMVSHQVSNSWGDICSQVS